jgi:hypothetical protein
MQQSSPLKTGCIPSNLASTERVLWGRPRAKISMPGLNNNLRATLNVYYAPSAGSFKPLGEKWCWLANLV